MSEDSPPPAVVEVPAARGRGWQLGAPRPSVAIVLLALWVAGFLVYSHAPGTHPAVALGSLLVFGLALPGIALMLTRSSALEEITASNPRRAALASVGYVALFSLCVLGPLFNYVSRTVADVRDRSLVLMAIKAITMIAIPLAIMKWQQFRVRRTSNARVLLFVMPLVALLTVIVLTPCVAEIVSLHLSGSTLVLAMGGTLVWVAVNAAMPEEILFRVYLQSALSARIRPEAYVVAATVLLFAGAHIPGLYFRADQTEALGTATPTVWLCTAYAIAVLAPAGFFFSVLWSRTRSLLILLLVHAAIDWLPNVADVSHQWLR